MTRENKPAAQSAARCAASLLTGALLLAGLTGCSGDLFLKGDSANSSMKAKPAVALAPGVAGVSIMVIFVPGGSVWSPPVASARRST